MFKTKLVIISCVISLCLSSVLCNINDTCSGTNVDTCTTSNTTLYQCVDSLCRCHEDNSYPQGVDCLPFKGPQPVTDVNVTDITATSFKITWTKPSQYLKEYEDCGATIYHVTDVKKGIKSRVSSKRLKGCNKEEYNFDDQTSFYFYKVCVHVIAFYWTAWTKSEYKCTDVFQTLPSAPGPVQDFKTELITGNFSHASVSWEMLNKDRHGNLTNFVLTVSSSKIQTETISPTCTNPTYSNGIRKIGCSYKQIIDVLYDTNYTLTIKADSDLYNGIESEHSYYAPEGPPPLPLRYDYVVSEPVRVTTKSFTFLFCSKCLLNENNGKVIYTAVVVFRYQPFIYVGKNINIDSVKKYKTWKQAQAYGSDKPFIVTQDHWVDDLKSITSDSEWTQFIVGDEEGCDKKSEDTICNGPLTDDTEYEVVLFTCTKAGCSYPHPHGFRFYTKSAAPYLPGEYQSVVKTDPIRTTRSSFTFSFCSKCLLNESSGEVIYTALVVCESLHCDDKLSKTNMDSLKKYRTWKQAREEGTDKPFIVTKDNWVDDLKVSGITSDSEWAQFIVGNEEGCDKKPEDTICNGPLKYWTGYSVSLFTCNKVKCSYKLDKGFYYTAGAETPIKSNVLPIILGILGLLLPQL